MIDILLSKKDGYIFRQAVALFLLLKTREKSENLPALLITIFKI